MQWWMQELRPFTYEKIIRGLTIDWAENAFHHLLGDVITYEKLKVLMFYSGGCKSYVHLRTRKLLGGQQLIGQKMFFTIY